MLSAGEVDAKAKRLLAPNQAWLYYLVFGGAYSALFVLGVYTENNIVLSLVWPANAFMLGMLVRFPLLDRPPGWIACLIGFAIAVMVVGYGSDVDAGLAVYSFGVVAIGYVLLSSLDRLDQRLERPTSIFYLLAAVVPACLYAGIAGSALGGPVFSTPPTVSDFRYWFSVELLNQLAFLPMILAFPEDRHWAKQLPLTLHNEAPIIVLVLSAVAGIFFGGIAAFAFPVPALLWCAISYRVFLTALLTFAFCAWAVIATTLGYIDVSNLSQSTVLSISMGGALITLGPLIISTTAATRNEVLDQLRYLAAEREIVSNELEHRIKNLFALVNGLVSLSARDNPSMRPLAKTLRERLVALQHAQGLIWTGSASSGAGRLTSLRELIAVLLSPYQGDKNNRFAISGDDAFVDSGIVTPLALVFHELATNSVKHGALGDPSGMLEVDIRRNINELHVKWTEKTSRPTGQPGVSTTGFGSKLLDLTIKSQLRGGYSRTWTAGRMEIEITLPGKLFHAVPHEPGDIAQQS